MTQYSDTYSSSGKKTWTAPDGIVSPIFLKVYGAGGGSGDAWFREDYYDNKKASASGANGGYAEGELSVSSGDDLYLYVGGGGGNTGGGYPDGGDGGYAHTETNLDGYQDDATTSQGGGGGGSTEVRHNSDTTSARVILAGGGGGGGAAVATAHDLEGFTDVDAGSGGSGGATASDGTDAGTDQTSGAGGEGGSTSGPGGDGEKASLTKSEDQATAAGGGGGGGINGGGGAGAQVDQSEYHQDSSEHFQDGAGGGGGGGSGYTGGVSNASMTQGGGSSGSGKVTIQYEAPPPAPQNLTYTLSRPDVTLSWDEVSSADGYNVYRRQEGGSLSQIDSVTGSTTTSYTDTPSDQVAEYYYAVTAYDSIGEGKYSNEVYVIFASGPHIYTNGTWTKERVKYWDGAAWQYGTLKEWNGTEWDIR